MLPFCRIFVDEFINLSTMHKLFILLSMATLCLLAACSPAGSSERASESSSVESTECSAIEEQALAAAQQFVRSQYASDAIFQQSGTVGK